ncbi:hypothetical protein JYU34_010297 [Plutella xylostella]|uniref:Integrase catalytic domain-containing protein n=1 Tax=Plutella xylostella TaxID=51655 RepID=A0ABQ7QI47_PLUXY|nr:hypothetical protein JYU34_010297 [Plutella xylostella]
MGLISKNISSSVCIAGVNGAKSHIADMCEISVQSLVNSYSKTLNCLVLPNITGYLPNNEINLSDLNMPSVIQLADPEFYRPSEIDMLLGAEVFYDILLPKQIKLGFDKPILQSSQLGFIVAGPLNMHNNSQKTKVHHCNFTKEISEKLTKFWELEEVPISNHKLLTSLDNEFCEKHFTENTRRLDNGRFSVSMPLCESESALGDSYTMAKRRFFSLEKKLNKNINLKQQYSDFIKEYETLGHLTEVEKPPFGYYLPHHAVVRESSETTKLRVVFDGSAKTSSGKSLNDIQHVGPVVQDELFDILIRFRQHKWVLTGDIQKMYRQVEINPSQRHLQMILWRDSDDESKQEPLRILQLKTVSYGTASAPYLSTRCLLQLARECSDEFIGEVIEHDFYMDDLLTGSDSEDGLRHIYQSVTNVLDSACFPIHKFRTNCPQIFSHETESLSLNLDNESNVLGLLWSPNPDHLKFSVKTDTGFETLTKRLILSNSCKIFDPLGLLSACVITLKIMLQNLWLLKLEWDDPVPRDITKLWNSLFQNIHILGSISVPRHAICTSPSNVSLEVFVDASQAAYAACVYLRSTNDAGDVNVRLLCSKSRVAPLKTATIPRLELCGALLGARLADRVTTALRGTVTKKTFWTDSTIVLGWIKTQPKVLKTFVCNRIQEIHELTSEDTWRWVPTSMNPSDLASRGIDPIELQSSTLWWHGPDYLKKDETEWPKDPRTKLDLPEIKTNVSTELKTDDLINFSDYSNSNKLIRIIAYVLRFINNCKNINKIQTEILQPNEIENSLTYLVKLSQQSAFSSELDTLHKKQSLKPKSKILQLSPFIDNNGVLRVGGRLHNVDCDMHKKNPALLDGKHVFTKLLMEAEHLRLLHAGPQLLLSSFREQYWPLGGRNLARNIVRNCTLCARLRGKAAEPLMGNLPSDRVNAALPFQICGVDYGGPFYISSKKGRGNSISKCYLCLFVCFTTKALHLELVSDLSSAAFILALRRFISRRGKMEKLYCDNSTTFVGSKNELNKVLRSSLKSTHEFSEIKFIFTPPYSPTFGGIWESGIKSAKHHLKRIMGNASLTFEELSTLFTQIEAVLNSRPLTPLSPDPRDLSPLTPGHFLIGRPLTALPSPQITRKNITRYEHIEKLRQHFWDRWRKEYLAELQNRTKWRTPESNLREGAMVVLKDNNLPPMLWKLGRVHKTYPGTDGVCRVADFLTTRGVERRAVNKVVPLPVYEKLENGGFQGPPDC